MQASFPQGLESTETFPEISSPGDPSTQLKPSTDWTTRCLLFRQQPQKQGGGISNHPGRRQKQKAAGRQHTPGRIFHQNSIAAFWVLLTGGEARWEVEELLEELPEPELG